MLEARERGKSDPDAITLVLMHFLGGSTREWDEVVEELGPGVRTVALDLPGFGKSADVPGYSVEQMADAVEYRLAQMKPGRFVLVGHSMSGKVAAVLARRHADLALSGVQTGGSDGRRSPSVHAEQLNGLAGLVLIAPSPPGPEPMGEEKRSQMLEALGEAKNGDRERAKSYITKNEERDIASAPLARSVDEVLKMKRAAWVAWLEHGSKEDWADRVGVLDLPALIVAGEKDRSLGPEVQQRVTVPHFSRAELRSVVGCSHLIPLERPQELALMLREFLAGLNQASSGLEIPPAYAALLASDRASDPTREVLAKRLAGPEPTEVLTPHQRNTLQAACARIVPECRIDLAGTIAARLATGKGKGWRYDVLPEDLAAYRTHLDALAAQGFAEMSPADQDAALQALDAEKKSAAGRWFEELRSDATEAWVSHPATMARLGYSGPFVGGAYTPHQGFVAIEIGQAEPWEPRAARAQENR